MKDEDQSSETADPAATEAAEDQNDRRYRDSPPEPAGGEERGSDPPFRRLANELPMAEPIPTPPFEGTSVLEVVRKPGIRRTTNDAPADIISRIERLERWVATNRP
jgi:hypothetical protein